jgi:predicted nucleic acid-binding protein
VERLEGYREVTDAYLLALAGKNDAALATFSRGVRVDAVRGAGKRNLAAIGVPTEARRC